MYWEETKDTGKNVRMHCKYKLYLYIHMYKILISY